MAQQKRKTCKVSTVLLRCSTDDSKEGFRAERPTGAIALTGFGDDAYWDPTLAQLHVLKGHNWAIITSGPSTIKERSIDQAKKSPRLLLANFSLANGPKVAKLPCRAK